MGLFRREKSGALCKAHFPWERRLEDRQGGPILSGIGLHAPSANQLALGFRLGEPGRGGSEAVVSGDVGMNREAV